MEHVSPTVQEEQERSLLPPDPDANSSSLFSRMYLLDGGSEKSMKDGNTMATTTSKDNSPRLKHWDEPDRKAEADEEKLEEQEDRT
jgi:hypothetical protein